MIDIDHVFDYYLEKGVTFRIKNFYLWYTGRKFSIIVIFLHSIELLFIFWVIISVFKLGIFWIALAVGLTQHMIFDILFNNDVMYPYGYFLSFRAIKRFGKENICRKFK